MLLMNVKDVVCIYSISRKLMLIVTELAVMEQSIVLKNTNVL